MQHITLKWLQKQAFLFGALWNVCYVIPFVNQPAESPSPSTLHLMRRTHNALSKLERCRHRVVSAAGTLHCVATEGNRCAGSGLYGATGHSSVVDGDNFGDVMEVSSRGPVLLDCWAPETAYEAMGSTAALILAQRWANETPQITNPLGFVARYTLNVAENPELAKHLSVQTTPQVMLLVDGTVADGAGNVSCDLEAEVTMLDLLRSSYSAVDVQVFRNMHFFWEGKMHINKQMRIVQIATQRAWAIWQRVLFYSSTVQPYNLTTLQPYNLTTLQPYNLTTLQPYNLTTLQPYNLTTLQPYNLTTLQPYNLTTLQPSTSHSLTRSKAPNTNSSKPTATSGTATTPRPSTTTSRPCT